VSRAVYLYTILLGAVAGIQAAHFLGYINIHWSLTMFLMFLSVALFLAVSRNINRNR